MGHTALRAVCMAPKLSSVIELEQSANITIRRDFLGMSASVTFGTSPVISLSSASV